MKLTWEVFARRPGIILKLTLAPPPPILSISLSLSLSVAQVQRELNPCVNKMIITTDDQVVIILTRCILSQCLIMPATVIITSQDNSDSRNRRKDEHVLRLNIIITYFGDTRYLKRHNLYIKRL